MRRSWSPRSRVHGLPMGRPIHGPLGAPSPAQVLGPQGEPRRMPALSIRTASKESLQSAARHIPADRSRAGGRSAGHSPGDASDSLLPWRATSWGLTSASIPPPAPAEHPRRARPDRRTRSATQAGWTAAACRRRPVRADGGSATPRGNSCFAYAAWLSRTRTAQPYVPPGSGFCPALPAAGAGFARRQRPSAALAGGLAGSQHPRLRPLVGTVPPNTEKEKWCGMLQRAPTVARLAPKSGQRCFGSR